MVKKRFNKKILLLDVNFDDENIIDITWIPTTKSPKKTYFNCGCCKNCLCNDTTSCQNCGCGCNCIEIDDYYEIDDDNDVK
jgi:hypothetical protein